MNKHRSGNTLLKSAIQKELLGLEGTNHDQQMTILESSPLTTLPLGRELLIYAYISTNHKNKNKHAGHLYVNMHKRLKLLRSELIYLNLLVIKMVLSLISRSGFAGHSKSGDFILLFF